MQNTSSDYCDKDAANLTHAVAQHQREWASLREVALHADFTCELSANLFSPLSPRVRAELEASRPALLGDGEKPGELAALSSTTALVHNVFGYWGEREDAPIAQACGASTASLSLRFAAQGPTHSQSSASHSLASPADVVLETNSRPTVIAADFLEPYARVDNHPDAELLDATSDWSDLQACHHVALDLRSNPSRFRHLPVTRLLSLGQHWTRESRVRGFRLLYLWYDSGGPAARRLRNEIDRFRMRAGGEIDFVAHSWQEVVAEMGATLRSAASDGGHATYFHYLRTRYFP